MPSPTQRAIVRRRAVLTAALAGSVVALTGCGIRLESDAPHIPGIQRQGPPPDQAALRAIVTQLDTAVDIARLDPSAWSAKLAEVHRVQRSRLAAVMATQGMTPPAHTPQPTGPSVDLAGLFAIEQEGARRIGSLVGLSNRNLPMAAAITVTENAGAQLLGHSVTLSGGTVPEATVTEAILPSLRAATYAFEVIVAKTPLDHRTRADTTLTMLHATRAKWEASLGKDLPVPPDGYALPVQPTTDARREQLARRTLTDLVTACAGQTTATRADRGALIGLTTLWADATAQLWRWGAKPSPFPGLKSVE